MIERIQNQTQTLSDEFFLFFLIVVMPYLLGIAAFVITQIIRDYREKK